MDVTPVGLLRNCFRPESRGDDFRPWVGRDRWARRNGVERVDPNPLWSVSSPSSALRSRRSTFGLAALLLFAGLTSLRAEEQILYPRPPAATEVPAPLRATGSNTTLLVFALVAAATGGWLLWHQRQSAGTIAGKDGRKLAIAETRSLGNRQYLVVADYDGKKFLLGVCPGRIDLLSPLDHSPPPAASQSSVK